MAENELNIFETSRRMEQNCEALNLLISRIESNDAPPAKAENWSRNFETSKLQKLDAIKAIFE